MKMSSCDNWDRLVGAVFDREKLIRLALSHSRTSSSSSSLSPTSSFSSTSNDFPNKNNHSNFLVVPKKHGIAWGEDSRYWNWTSDVHSRFLEVAELNHVWWLDIRGKIETRLLSPETSYAAFLVFKLAHHASNLEVANAMIRFVNEEKDEQAERRATVVHLQPTSWYPINGRAAVPRRDGWMEVQLGNFGFEDGYAGDVEARLLETTDTKVKTGLIIGGIEFRQVHVSGPEATLSPNKSLTSGKGLKKKKKSLFKFY